MKKSDKSTMQDSNKNAKEKLWYPGPLAAQNNKLQWPHLGKSEDTKFNIL